MSAKTPSEEVYKLKLAKKRKRQALLSFLLWLFIIITLSASIFLFWNSSFVMINDVEIRGEDEKINEEIEKLIFVPTSVFSFDTNKMQKEIGEKFPLIKNISAKKGYFPKASAYISYDMREPYGIYCIPSAWCIPFDEQGIAIESIVSGFSPAIKIFNQKTGEYIPNRVEEVLGKSVIDEDILDQFLIIESSIKDTFLGDLISVSRLDVYNDDSYRIMMDTATTNDAFYFIVDKESMRDASTKIFLALKTLEDFESIEYVDIRFGNKIYWYNKEK